MKIKQKNSLQCRTKQKKTKHFNINNQAESESCTHDRNINWNKAQLVSDLKL